jgi:cation-transporting ATPase 13A3/4/5
MRRENVENDLEFLGMVVLENRLKPETEPVIGVLKGAGVKIVMITGRKGKERIVWNCSLLATVC